MYSNQHEELKKLNIEVSKLSTKVTDEVVKIKLQEVKKYIKPLEKTERMTNECIVNLLQYYELLNEL